MASAPIPEARNGDVDWAYWLGAPKLWVRDVLISAALSVWLGLVGPFGSYRSTEVGMRVACYLSMCLITTAVYGIGGRLAVRVGERFSVAPWISMAIAFALISVPMSFVVAFFVVLFNPVAASTSRFEWYLQTVAIMLPLGLAYLGLQAVSTRLAAGGALAPDAKAAPSRLTARLPGKLGSDILALEAEDHYVRVHTVKGSALLLMRISDAISELDGMEGQRVHRSWWVAKAAVVGFAGKDRRLVVKLPNDLEAPVARASIAAARRMARDS